MKSPDEVKDIIKLFSGGPEDRNVGYSILEAMDFKENEINILFILKEVGFSPEAMSSFAPNIEKQITYNDRPTAMKDLFDYVKKHNLGKEQAVQLLKLFSEILLEDMGYEDKLVVEIKTKTDE